VFNFKTAPTRKESNAEKYRLCEKLFGTNDLLPAWVADMDIETPPFIVEAIKKRLEEAIFGYEEMPDSAFLAQIAWMKKNHNVEFSREELFYSPSVVATISLAIEAFSKEGEGVIVQTPVYTPFFKSVQKLGRKVIKNPLSVSEDGKYLFDIEDFKSKIDENCKLLLLCSPHNPVGRVWKREELEAIAEVCYERGIVIFADEIHCDLVYAPYKHTPFASLNAKARDISVTAIGVGKTFNMAGFAISSVAIPNKQLRERFTKHYERVHFAQGSILSHVAFETAYREGSLWLDELKVHLYSNYKLLVKLSHRYSYLIKITPIEGTYLAWIDCRGMRMGDKALREWFIKEAKLGLNAGIAFGREGSGFMRLNFAVPSDTMLDIIERLQRALEAYDKD
jgi:cystathionine beta-lyase